MADLSEVCLPIPFETASVLLPCPACGVSEVRHASAWPSINTDGVFVISPIATFGMTCNVCSEPFVFRPRHKLSEQEAV
jgi:hypothetical protein